MILLIDCDETLYPHSAGIMKDIGTLINQYMLEKLQYDQAEVTQKRKFYIDTYGTTLNGLMKHEEIDPKDYCLYVHQLDLNQYIDPNPDLHNIFCTIKHPKILFTNAPRFHADRVLEILNISQCFDGGYYIEDFNYESKPKLDVFEYVNREVRLKYPNENEVVLVDDYIRNLVSAKNLGWRTIWVGEATPSGLYHNSLSTSQAKRNDSSKEEIAYAVDVSISSINDLPIALEKL